MTGYLNPVQNAWIGAQFHGIVVNGTNQAVIVNGLPSATAFGTGPQTRGTQEDLIIASFGVTLQPGASAAFGDSNSFLDVYGDPVTWSFNTSNVYASWSGLPPAGCPAYPTIAR